jgi:hypothetical protein
MHLTEAATLDRKSGGAEGSAIPRSLPGNDFRPLDQHLLLRKKSKGAPGLAFETWDPCNRSQRKPHHKICGQPQTSGEHGSDHRHGGDPCRLGAEDART